MEDNKKVRNWGEDPSTAYSLLAGHFQPLFVNLNADFSPPFRARRQLIPAGVECTLIDFSSQPVLPDV